MRASALASPSTCSSKAPPPLLPYCLNMLTNSIGSQSRRWVSVPRACPSPKVSIHACYCPCHSSVTVRNTSSRKVCSTGYPVSSTTQEHGSTENCHKQVIKLRDCNRSNTERKFVSDVTMTSCYRQTGYTEVKQKVTFRTAAVEDQ
jgi:hypothetical protein